MKNVVIIGATSAIAEALAKLYANENANLVLLARDQSKLGLIKDDLLVRGASSVSAIEFDASLVDDIEDVPSKIIAIMPKIDVFVVAHGSLPDQQVCQESSQAAMQEIRVNGLSVISLLTSVANFMERQKSGNITVITSVAGDRGRQSNYVYGAAKGMVSIFLQGLGQRLSKSGVHVLDIKPGFVDTPMTAEFQKGFLWAKPEQVAQLIHQRIAKKSNLSYAPLFWFFIMSIIKTIPQRIFNKLKL